MGKLKALTATDTIVIVAEDSHADVAAAARALLPLGLCVVHYRPTLGLSRHRRRRALLGPEGAAKATTTFTYNKVPGLSHMRTSLTPRARLALAANLRGAVSTAASAPWIQAI